MHKLLIGISAAIYAVALVLSADAANAGGHQVGPTFFDKDDQSANANPLALLTVDGANKAAALIVDIHHSDASLPADRLVIGFYDKHEWHQFVVTWNKARHAKRPTEAEVYARKSEVGTYFDADLETSVTVSVGTEGQIDLAMAGKPDANKNPTLITLFELEPRDFDAFDKAVKSVTTYFAN